MWYRRRPLGQHFADSSKRWKLFFAFIMVFAVLLVGLVLVRDIDPIGIFVVAVLSFGITVWLSKPSPGDEPNGGSNGDSGDDWDDEPPDEHGLPKGDMPR